MAILRCNFTPHTDPPHNCIVPAAELSHTGPSYAVCWRRPPSVRAITTGNRPAAAPRLNYSAPYQFPAAHIKAELNQEKDHRLCRRLHRPAHTRSGQSAGHSIRKPAVHLCTGEKCVTGRRTPPLGRSSSLAHRASQRASAARAHGARVVPFCFLHCALRRVPGACSGSARLCMLTHRRCCLCCRRSACAMAATRTALTAAAAAAVLIATLLAATPAAADGNVDAGVSGGVAMHARKQCRTPPAWPLVLLSRCRRTRTTDRLPHAQQGNCFSFNNPKSTYVYVLQCRGGLTCCIAGVSGCAGPACWRIAAAAVTHACSLCPARACAQDARPQRHSSLGWYKQVGAPRFVCCPCLCTCALRAHVQRHQRVHARTPASAVSAAIHMQGVCQQQCPITKCRTEDSPQPQQALNIQSGACAVL